jgi:hypothetical protein
MNGRWEGERLLLWGVLISDVMEGRKTIETVGGRKRNFVETFEFMDLKKRLESFPQQI